MKCRPNCGACCIAPSINFPYFGMPEGKPAGVACTHLDLSDMSCKIWNTENYPETCRQFAASSDICGESSEDAIRILESLEHSTKP